MSQGNTKNVTVSLLSTSDCLLWMPNGRSQACLSHSSSSSSATVHCYVQPSTCWHFPPLKRTLQGFLIFSTETAVTSDPSTSLKGQRENNMGWPTWGNKQPTFRNLIQFESTSTAVDGNLSYAGPKIVSAKHLALPLAKTCFTTLKFNFNFFTLTQGEVQVKVEILFFRLIFGCKRYGGCNSFFFF